MTGDGDPGHSAAMADRRSSPPFRRPLPRTLMRDARGQRLRLQRVDLFNRPAPSEHVLQSWV
jgi:hypothetical protein